MRDTQAADRKARTKFIQIERGRDQAETSFPFSLLFSLLFPVSVSVRVCVCVYERGLGMILKVYRMNEYV